MKYFYAIILLFTCQVTIAQKQEKLLIGNWIEVRRERKGDNLEVITNKQVAELTFEYDTTEQQVVTKYQPENIFILLSQNILHTLFI